MLVRSAAFSYRLATFASFGRHFTSSKLRLHQVTVVGGAGGIGQPLSLLFKLSEHISRLHVYDVAPFTAGVATDLDHCDTPVRAVGFTDTPNDKECPNLARSLVGSDLVIVPAGFPRKPGMLRDDLFNKNAEIAARIALNVAKNCPKANLLIITNPVNSTVPIAAEILRRCGVYDSRKLFGVTTLDVVRANTFVAEHLKADVRTIKVPVIGGHAGATIIPLLSRVPNANFSQQNLELITQRVMFGGDEVVKAKAGAGSATLSMAYAAYRFAVSVLKAKSGVTGIEECTYTEVTHKNTPRFFAGPVLLGKDGVEKVLPLPNLSDFEADKLHFAFPELHAAIDKGIEYGKNYPI